jgi:tetratricopeptide (TPR) repeat protein
VARVFTILATLVLLNSCIGLDAANQIQGYSLSGEPLVSAPPSVDALQKLAAAKAVFAANPKDADAIIWFGRRTAYTGDYLSSIDIFSDAIALYPSDPRLYRHRGHRYISIREFAKAAADLETAASLIQGKANAIEPDGLPNAQNIPLTTTHGNIWYHLGLTYYLLQDWPNALRAFEQGYGIGGNDDNLVSTGHWIYMIHRRMGNADAAAAALGEINGDMTIIENMSYHQLCLLYTNEISIDQMMAANGDDPSNAAVAYGIANYYYYNGDREKSDALLNSILQGSSWASFGYIAAEADLANPKR